MRKCISTLAVLVISGLANSAMGSVIADFGADYTTPTPAAGWQYVHNGLNVTVGTEGSYTVNQYNAGGNWYTTGGVNLPAGAPDSYSVVGKNFIHPGQGSSQAADGFDHYTLAKYTLASGGQTDVTSLSASTANGSGITMWVSVNGGPNLVPVADQTIPGGGSYAGPVTFNLGVLSALDRVYVGIGPNGNDGNDSTTIQFQIAQTPEPASVGILAMSGLGLLARRRRAVAI